MGSDAIKNYGAKGRTDLLLFDPDDLIVIEDPNHPLYDERVGLPIDDLFLGNIRQHGVTEPITVKRDGFGEDGLPRVLVFKGRQRTRALRIVNQERRQKNLEPFYIKAQWYRDTGDADEADTRSFELIISENAHRVATPPVMEARQIQRYLDKGRSPKLAAALFHMSEETVRLRLLLLDCAPEVQKAVDASRIGATLAAKEFAKLPRDKQGEALKTLLANGTHKGEAAAEAVQKFRSNGAAGANGVAKPKPMKKRKFIDNWRRKLTKCQESDAREVLVARAVLGYVLGNEKALDDYPKIKAVLE